MNQFRIGNFVDTRDGAGISRIIDIEKNEVFNLEKISKPGEVFVSYKEKIRPILLTNYHLDKLGFNEHKKQYSMNGLKIVEITEIEGFGYIFHGHMVLPEDFNKPLNSETIKQLPQVTYLHSLQNYCADNQISLDFNSIK